jgi:mono/diheme cytochrome c family protein
MRLGPALLVLTLAVPALMLASGCSERRDPPATGSVLFLRYCASCHGADGKGHGPIAPTLVRGPADLTSLARRNGGRFDERAVMAYIDGERDVAEHGPREMPVWGAAFERARAVGGESRAAYVALLDVRALVDYLRSIQEP